MGEPEFLRGSNLDFPHFETRVVFAQPRGKKGEISFDESSPLTGCEGTSTAEIAQNNNNPTTTNAHSASRFHSCFSRYVRRLGRRLTCQCWYRRRRRLMASTATFIYPYTAKPNCKSQKLEIELFAPSVTTPVTGLKWTEAKWPLLHLSDVRTRTQLWGHVVEKVGVPLVQFLNRLAARGARI
jgi:hypothetical protein